MSLKNLYTSTGVLISLTVGCGSQSENQQAQDTSDVKIVGGFQPTVSNDFGRSLSGTVALTNDRGRQLGRSFCSGTIIGKNTILTAAHCVTDDFGRPNQFQMYVFFGQDMQQQRSSSLFRRVKAFIPHGGYDPVLTESGRRIYQKSHDIAVLSFEGTTPSSHTPVPVLGAGESLTRTAYLSGFGTTGKLTGNGTETESDTGTLRAVQVRVAEEHPRGGVFYVEGKDQFGLPHGACPGDSGGPTYVQKNGTWYVAGALSTGHTGVVDANGNGFIDINDIGCLGENYYSDTREYSSWIRAQQVALGETFGDNPTPSPEPQPNPEPQPTGPAEFNVSRSEASNAISSNSRTISLRFQAQNAARECSFTLTTVREVRDWFFTRTLETNHVSQTVNFARGQIQTVSFRDNNAGRGSVTSASLSGTCAGTQATINIR